MMKDAKSVGMRMNLTSAYRTYMKQVYLFKNKIERLEREGYSHEKAVKEAGTVVAVPGTSEHQLGLTLDFVTGSYKNLDEGIRNTKEYQWTEKHAWEYGYVIRLKEDAANTMAGVMYYYTIREAIAMSNNTKKKLNSLEGVGTKIEASESYWTVTVKIDE